MTAGLRRLADRARILGGMLGIRLFRRPRFPFYVNLVINSRCSLRCAYCFGSYPQRGGRDLPFAEFVALADELARRGTRYVLIQGGEPLLHPDLGRMIRHLRARRIVVALSTNGQHPDRFDELPELDLMDNLCFSLDGNEAGNDRVRGAGSFARVLTSIAAARRRFTVPLRINTTVHRFVAADAPFLADLVRREGLEWGVSFLFRGGAESGGGEPLGLTAGQVRDYLGQLLAGKRQGVPIFTTARVLRYAAEWPVGYDQLFLDRAAARRRLPRGGIECQYGHYELVIDEDGTLYPCQALQGRFAGKNYRRDGFAAAFAHLATKPCHTCYLMPLINTSAMINGDWGVIGETIWETIRNRWVRRAPRRLGAAQE